MGSAFEALQKLVSAIHPLKDEAMKEFLSIWEPFDSGRKQTITAAGETERYLYFVCDGVQRVYFCGDDGREATLVFTYAPSFGGVLDSFLLQQPSRYFYETLTPSVFLKAPYKSVERLMQNHHDVETLIRKGITSVVSGVLERFTEVLCFPAEERFRILLNRSPHILQLVPHKYLANYLGMDASNFSKLINKVKI